MLSLENRPAMLGTSLNTRTEKHGDEDVPAHDIPLEGVMLDERELNALLGHPGAHTALFDRGSKLEEPAFPSIKALVMKDKFENSTVRLNVGGLQDHIIELAGCTVAKVTLLPLAGGLTQLDCQVQAISSDVSDLPAIVKRLGKDVHVAIDLGEAAKPTKGKQQDLPINTFGEGESTAKPKGKRGRSRKHAPAGDTLQ